MGDLRGFDIEDLPFPLVLYPLGGAAFFYFSADFDGESVMCGCHRQAIANYYDLEKGLPPRRHSVDRFSLMVGDLPSADLFIDALIAKGASKDDLLDSIKFRDGVCHLCAGRQPERKYTAKKRVPKILGPLIWYERFYCFHLGIHPAEFTYLKGAPEDLRRGMDAFYVLDRQCEEENRRIMRQAHSEPPVNAPRLPGKVDPAADTGTTHWPNVSQAEIDALRAIYRARNKIKREVMQRIAAALVDHFKGGNRLEGRSAHASLQG